jgi:hypothetical protein
MSRIQAKAPLRPVDGGMPTSALLVPGTCRCTGRLNDRRSGDRSGSFNLGALEQPSDLVAKAAAWIAGGRHFKPTETILRRHTVADAGSNPQANTCCPAFILRDGWAGVSGTAGGWTVPASDLLLAVYGTAIVFRVLLAMKRGRRRSILGPVE